jgi:hypothetical protein
MFDEAIVAPHMIEPDAVDSRPPDPMAARRDIYISKACMRAGVRRPRENENKVINVIVHGSILRSPLRLPCYSVAVPLAPHFPIWGRWG